MASGDPSANRPGSGLAATALARTGTGAWTWDSASPDVLLLQWCLDQAPCDVREQIDDEQWHHLTLQLQQALAEPQPLHACVDLGIAPARRPIEMLGAADDGTSARVVGLCWPVRAETREDGQGQWAPLAKLAHELRSPLAAVMQEMHEVRQQVQGTGLEEKLRSMQEGAQHMLRITEDMLLAFKAGEPQTVREPECLTTRRLVAQLTASAVERARRKGISMQVERAAGFPEQFLAEPTALRRLLQNLIDNAVKYTERGQVMLRLHVAQAAEGPLLCFEVSDTGPGMTAEELQRAFEPFAQGAAGRARAAGLGIGLALSRQLAIGLDGELQADSRPGQGSRFRLSIPARPPAPGAMARRSPVGAAGGPGIRSAGTRVLLVDDQPNLSRLTARALSRLGCEVDVAASGEEAVACVSRRPPDVAILDLDLPDTSGCDLCRLLAARVELRHCRFVAYSGSDAAADRLAAARAGFHAFRVKPATPAELLGT